MSEEIRPFTVAIEESELQDLRERLDRTRWPESETCEGWNQGIPLAYTRELAQYWLNDYDWRRCEQKLNSWPQFKTDHRWDRYPFYPPRKPRVENALPPHYLPRLAGARWWSSTKSSMPWQTRNPTAVMPRMPFTWWRRPCPASAFPANQQLPARR